MQQLSELPPSLAAQFRDHPTRRLLELQYERQSDRLLSQSHAGSHRAEYPAHSEEYLRQKAARHRECYLAECYVEPEFDRYADADAERVDYYPLPGVVTLLAVLFRLPAELVIDILRRDPDAGLPSSWPDVDALKRARLSDVR